MSPELKAIKYDTAALILVSQRRVVLESNAISQGDIAHSYCAGQLAALEMALDTLGVGALCPECGNKCYETSCPCKAGER